MPEGTGAAVVTLATMASDKYGLVGFFLFLLLIGLAGIVIYFLTRNWQRRETADTDGQMTSVNIYKEMLADERKARAEADARADSFSKLYSEAVRQIGELAGELRAVKQQLDRVTEELEAMREKFNAKP